MKKALLSLLLLLPMGVTAANDVPPPITAKPFSFKAKSRASQATDIGVKATLKYEQLKDMNVARMAHQTFTTPDGSVVVVGGRTTNFQLTKTAEVYKNGSWNKINLLNAHDGAFMTTLSDGRVMVGGGFSSGSGVGQSVVTDIYDPTTGAFSAGPNLTVKRAQAKAITTSTGVYVSGNWYASDETMDYYNGSSFSATGQTDARTNPYLMTDRSGVIYVMSSYNTQGQSFGYYTYDDGTKCLLVDKYDPSTGKTEYFAMPFDQSDTPMYLPDDTRSSDYHLKYDGNNCYMILNQTSNGYMLYMLDLDEKQLYYFGTLDIPTIDADGKTITWRGNVIVNSGREELYLIGASGTVTNQTLHVISMNYNTGDWTIASAGGFKHNLLTASWAMLGDGRLVCTGGGVKDNTDAQRKTYLITPQVAGTDDIPTTQTGGPRLIVWLKSGEKVVYELGDAPVTTFNTTQLIIRTNKVTVPYERKNVLRYTYEDVKDTGIGLVPGDRRVQVNSDGDEVTFRGLKAGTAAYIYNVNGMLVAESEASDGEPLTISLRNHPKGVYIIKAGTETIKLMKQ